MNKSDENPINPVQRLRNAPRCRATAKSTGQRCQCPSKQGWNVCRLHGAGGGAQSGSAHPNYRHGLRSQELRRIRQLASFLRRAAYDTLEEPGQ
jgi:hypothetical protein